LPARVGGADNLTEGFTVRPRLMFGPRFVPVPTASLGVSVGGTWLWYQAASDLVIIPYPTVSTAVQLKPGAGGRYGVRLAVSYMYIWSSNDKALLGITLAFTWGS
jgi:hypothetical protein